MIKSKAKQKRRRLKKLATGLEKIGGHSPENAMRIKDLLKIPPAEKGTFNYVKKL